MRALALSSTSIYHINMSVFRSAPDLWAIGQVLPVLPLHRLMERPTVRATLADLTCDSDGHLTRFVMAEEVILDNGGSGSDSGGGGGSLGAVAEPPSIAMLLHPLERFRASNGGEVVDEGGVERSKEGTETHALDVCFTETHAPYVLGMFLGGVYQETMGSAHNLFGAPAVVHVSAREGHDGDGGCAYEVSVVASAESTAEVLRAQGRHDAGVMAAALEADVAEAVAAGGMAAAQVSESLHFSAKLVFNLMAKKAVGFTRRNRQGERNLV